VDRRGIVVALSVALLLAAILAVWLRFGGLSSTASAGDGPAAAEAPSAGAREPSPAPLRGDPTARRRAQPGPEGSAASAPSGEERRALWEKRLDRAQHTLDSYLAATRYPPESRPISEHPDLVDPHHVEPVTLPLARQDGKLTDAKVVLRQDRFFLVGDVRGTLSVTCETSEGPAQCGVARAVAGVPPSADGAGVRPEAPVPFEAGEAGAMVASFQPSSQGFSGYHGTIRISLALHVDGETGGASFDVQYTPSAPAAFTGKIREALLRGSLDLYAELEVERPGRYVITARVDDAAGKSFAYVTFNEEIGAGKQEARLRIFGKLVRDLGAPSPFRLRDVEGFLLKEDTFPDRELMAAMEGTVHTTKRYLERDFSDSEWESEEKDRHVKEFAKDILEAQQNAEVAEPP
jgi:hypothetical protein